jgi:hypothetical protein
MKYTIERDDYHDKNGKITKTAVYIKYRKSFFGLFTYWKYITHRDCGMSDCYDARTNFSTQEKAENFIKEILCPGKTYDNWNTTVINEITCT